MRLRILGENGKDRGTQLETLTTLILNSLGYTDIVTNKISYGGYELDVDGKFQHPAIGEVRTTRLICECKAYSKSLGTTDWMKFLGKIFTEELSNSDPVNGVMIALSGVNGNVLGQYEQLRKHRTDIEIVTGEKLVGKLKKIYPLRDPEDITSEIYGSTSRTITTLELAYYERQFIYIVSFSDNSHTTVSANRSKPISSYKEMIELIDEHEKLGNRVELSAEREFENRKDGFKKIILTTLLALDRPCEIEQIPKEWENVLGTKDQLDMCDLADIIPELIELGLVTNSDNSISLNILSDPSIENRAIFFNHLLRGSVILPGLKLEQYDSLIDDDILGLMESNHNCTPVPDQDRHALLEILKWSPTALLGAINPPQMSKSAIENGQHLHAPDDFSYVVLRKHLIDRFVRDYNSIALHEYFKKHRNIHEIETTSRIVAKSNKKIELDLNVRHRIGIGQRAESWGGGHILINMKLDNPEPWEPWPRPEPKTKDDAE